MLLVVVCHGFYFNPHGPRWTLYAGQVLDAGYIGVQLFFVLSGFLISYPFFQRRANPEAWYPAGYATRRLLKIFPPFYLSIILLAMYYNWHYRDPNYYAIGLQWATGFAHFVNRPKYFNTSFWSIWVEVGFYVLLPVLLFCFRHAGKNVARWGIFSVLFFGSLITRMLVWPPPEALDQARFLTARFPGSLDNFAWGVLFASYYVEAGRGVLPAMKLAKLGYVGFVALCLTQLGLGLLACWNHPIAYRLEFEMAQLFPGLSAALMLFFLFDPNSLGCRALSSPALRFVGLVSYEWFLLHQPAQHQFREWLGHSGGQFTRYFAIVLTPTVLTFLVAAGIYHAFSLPILRWGRRRTQASRQKAARVPATGLP